MSTTEDLKRLLQAENLTLRILQESGQPLSPSDLLLKLFGCSCGHTPPRPEAAGLDEGLLRRAWWSLIAQGKAVLTDGFCIGLPPA